jgi:hypothetical protein
MTPSTTGARPTTPGGGRVGHDFLSVLLPRGEGPVGSRPPAGRAGDARGAGGYFFVDRRRGLVHDRRWRQRGRRRRDGAGLKARIAAPISCFSRASISARTTARREGRSRADLTGLRAG